MKYHISVWTQHITVIQVEVDISILFYIPWIKDDGVEKSRMTTAVSNVADWRLHD